MTLELAEPHDLVLAALTGLLMGSFISVLVVRLPKAEAIAVSRSRCSSCGQRLSVRDLIPLVSWILSRGHCRTCGERILVLYPILEISSVGIAIWAAFVLDGWLFWVSCGLGWTLLALAATDLRSFILPDLLTLPLVGAGVAVTYFIDPQRLPHHVIGALVGFGLLYALGWLYRRIRDRAGLGLGDAKMLAAAGMWLGWVALPSVLLIAAATALIAVGNWRFFGRRLGAADPVPFGTFLALGFWIVWLYGPLTV